MFLNPKTPHRDKIKQAFELAQKDDLDLGFEAFYRKRATCIY